MKFITLHSDFIKFKALKKALKSLDLSKEPTEEKEVKDSLVVLTAVEKGDDKETIKKLVEEVKKIAKQVKVSTIVLYPYAHLSSNLGSPKQAQQILNETEKALKKAFKKVVKAPFGYYKSFEIKVKGHPLSELSREISGKGEVKDEQVEDSEIKEIVRKMSKVKMSAPKGKSGLKSNVELGRDLDLYIVSEVVGGGLPLFTPKGTTIRREIERFIVDEELKRGYKHTSTPIMAKSDLYKVSGHWQHYQKDMFKLKVGNDTFALRPMSCPFHYILYKRKPRSYKELPIKYAEIAQLFRNEQSGELRGLTRLRQFSLADAHIICTRDQLEKQFEEVLDLVKYVMEKLGIEVWYRFSKHDSKNKAKYIDNPKAWKDSELLMKKILDKLKIKYKEAKDEAAFYGPKLDLQYKDVYGKEDTLITLQIDFSAPERFDLKYLDKNGKEKRPMVFHRSSVGAIERTIAYMLEKTQGALPTWLSPIQVRVINFTDRNNKQVESVVTKIKQELPNIRIDTDLDSVPLSGKIRDAELMKIPYIIVLGDKEKSSKTLAVRKRGSKQITSVTIDNFIKNIKKEIEERK